LAAVALAAAAFALDRAGIGIEARMAYAGLATAAVLAWGWWITARGAEH
jgi:hypothetical protein